MNKFGLILLFAGLAKRHEKLSKGNSEEPFAYKDCTRLARA